MTEPVQLIGLDDLLAKLRDPRWLNDAAAELLDRWRFTVERGAKERAPVWRGHLRRSLTSERDNAALPLWARAGTNVPYARPVEEGSRPHWPPIAAITPWAVKHGIPPFVLARSIAEKGTKPHPFLGPAAEEAARQLPAWLEQMAASIERRAEAN